ncbi:MAG: cysteine desulfurase [Deltaproteobacteria bacterium]|jgi:cysteine desulfurase|nr:cysteine desulfurase [Deltaproteobacteria bacterium]
MAMTQRIYLDNAATTPVSSAVFEAMRPYFTEIFGNPSAIHSYGQEAHKALETARRSVAKCLGALSSEIFFTSGGTESDNWALRSVAETCGSWGRRIISSAIEHNAVLKTLEKLSSQGFEVTLLKPTQDGLISPESLKRALSPDTILVSIMMANNVVGSIQDIKALAKVVKESQSRTVFHVDAVQAAGYLPINVRDLGVDLLSLSAHKFHGPKGVGALFAKIPRLPASYMTGGGQERGGRSGTENTPGIVGLAKALEEAVSGFERTNELATLRDELIAGLTRTPGVFLTGPKNNRLPGLASFVVEGIGSSVYLINLLNERGVAASSGAACSASSREASHVLRAMGYSEELASGTLRFSISRYNTAQEIKALVDMFPGLVKELRAQKNS